MARSAAPTAPFTPIGRTSAWARAGAPAPHTYRKWLRLLLLLCPSLLAILVWHKLGAPEFITGLTMPPQSLVLAAVSSADAAAVRHEARRAMFGGFKDAETEYHLGGENAGALMDTARALAAEALAEPAPTAGRDPHQSNLSAGEKGIGLNPWLPRLGNVRSAAEALGLRSYYSRWIVADLSVWGDHGITKELVAAAAAQTCHGSKLRFQVINGSLWVDHVSKRGPEGWYPGAWGEGWISGKGRVPMMLLMLFDVLRSFPGQARSFTIDTLPAAQGARMPAPMRGQRTRCNYVPDVDAVVSFGDAPCIWYDNTRNQATPQPSATTAPGSLSASKVGVSIAAKLAGALPGGMHALLASAAGGGAPGLPPPLMTFDTSVEHADIPLPDFSYYGHELDRLPDEVGEPVVGWTAQLSALRRASAGRPFKNRASQVAWRGRTQGERDFWRYKFVNCPANLSAAGRDADAALFNLYTPDLRLPDLSDYRYNAYIESGAWSTNLKQKLAAGSPVLALVPRFPEWFSRALLPGVHFLALQPRAGGPLDFCDGVVALVREMEEAAERRGAAWVSSSPQRIASHAARFLRDHLQMAHLRQYVLDVLKTYAALQVFQVTPSEGAVLYNRSMLVEQFAFPYQKDADRIVAAYPWLSD